MNKKIAVIGGDMRQIYVSKYLKSHGFEVVVYGFDNELSETTHTFREALQNADAVVLGLPVTTDGIYISTPCWSDKLLVSDLLSSVSSDSLLLGGKVSCAFKETCQERSIKVVDYLDREELTVLNTIPTAEGAIEIAMREIPYTLHDSNCLVVGFGRVGKTLSLLLKAFNANVTCSARKHEDFAWIRTLGLTSASTSELVNIVHDFDIIFNTVPGKIFTEDVLKNLSGDALIIDLASKPGGVDFEAAKEYGKKVIWALSIPGKFAPATAGRITADTIINILNE